jgi:hypothetical protein
MVGLLAPNRPSPRRRTGPTPHANHMIAPLEAAFSRSIRAPAAAALMADGVSVWGTPPNNGTQSALVTVAGVQSDLEITLQTATMGFSFARCLYWASHTLIVRIGFASGSPSRSRKSLRIHRLVRSHGSGGLLETKTLLGRGCPCAWYHAAAPSCVEITWATWSAATSFQTPSRVSRSHRPTFVM